MTDPASPATLGCPGGRGRSSRAGRDAGPHRVQRRLRLPGCGGVARVALGRSPGHVYSRNTNPTVRAFEEKVRILEGADSATSFATGMAAISNTLFALLSPGDRVVSVKDTYGGTNRLFLDFLPRSVSRWSSATPPTTSRSRRPSPGLPAGLPGDPDQPDAEGDGHRPAAAAAHAVGALVVADNTFATPINQNPLALGADLVLHSATKFLGGHADALGGVLCGARAGRRGVPLPRDHGRVARPMAAYLLVRGMKTLALRIGRQNESAPAYRAVAPETAGSRGGQLSGARDSPAPRVAARQMRGFGGCSASGCEGGLEAVKRVLPRLRLAHRAANLGAVETLAGPGHHEPRGVHRRGARGHGHPRRVDPLLGRHRGRRRSRSGILTQALAPLE